MNRPAPDMPSFPIGRSIAALVVIWAVVTAASVGPVWLLWAEGHAWVGLAQGLVCLLASVAAMQFVKWAAQQSMETLLTAGLAGTGIRLVMCLASAFGLVYGFGAGSRPTAIWTLVFYAVFLVADVMILARYFRRLGDEMVGTGDASSLKEATT